MVTKSLGKNSARKLLKHLLKKYGRPGVIVTDHLSSYRAALTEIGCQDKQQTGQWMNNRAENGHLVFYDGNGL